MELFLQKSPSQMFGRVLHTLLLFGSQYAEAYSEPNRTSKMGHFAKIVNGFQSLTIFAKSSILDDRLVLNTPLKCARNKRIRKPKHIHDSLSTGFLSYFRNQGNLVLKSGRLLFYSKLFVIFKIFILKYSCKMFL